jgi:hypothetical protein
MDIAEQFPKYGHCQERLLHAAVQTDNNQLHINQSTYLLNNYTRAYTQAHPVPRNNDVLLVEYPLRDKSTTVTAAPQECELAGESNAFK